MNDTDEITPAMIAASPQMLDALWKVLGFLEDVPYADAMEDVVDAAIRAAEGR